MTMPSTAYEAGDLAPGEGREVVVVAQAAPPAIFELDAKQVNVLKATVAVDATDAELNLFVQFCLGKQLDPFSGQVYFVKYQGKPSFIIGIDGMRALAERGGYYAGQDEPEFREQGGEWSTDWDEDEPPYEARVTVYRKGSERPFRARAKLTAYAGYRSQKNGGGLNQFWAKMPELMLAKCAESLALRKAFPDPLAGLYTTEEMGQVGREDDHMRGHIPEKAESFESQEPKVLEGEVMEDKNPVEGKSATSVTRQRQPKVDLTEQDAAHEQLMSETAPKSQPKAQIDPKTMKEKPQEEAPQPAQEEEPLLPEPEGASAPAEQPAAAEKAPRTTQQFLQLQADRGHTLATMLKIFDIEDRSELKAAVKKNTIAGSMMKVEAYESQVAAAVADGADADDDLPFDDPGPEE